MNSGFAGIVVKQSMLKNTVIVGAALCALAVSTPAEDVDISKLPPASAQKEVTFAKDIKPMFEKACFSCHGEEKQKAKLRVDSVEAIKKGSREGEVIVVGDSAKSRLVHSVAGLIEDMMMPPEDKGDPLTKEQIGLLRAGIDQGAK